MHFVLELPSPAADYGHDRKQQADEEHQIANVQQRGILDDFNVVEGAQQNFEGYLASEGVGVFRDADAGDSDSGIDFNLLHGRQLDVLRERMPVNGGEELAIGAEDVLVLRSPTSRRQYPPFDGD